MACGAVASTVVPRAPACGQAGRRPAEATPRRRRILAIWMDKSYRDAWSAPGFEDT